LLSRVTLQNTTVTMKNPVSERNVFYIHNDDILIDKNSRFICAKGYQTAITGIESFLPPSGHFSLFSMLCRACEYNHYSVVESSFMILNHRTLSVFLVHLEAHVGVGYQSQKTITGAIKLTKAVV